MISEQPDFEDLTDISSWSERPDASLEDYAQAKLNPELLLGVLRLLRPDLILHEDQR